MRQDLKYLVTILIMFTISFALIGGDCGTDNEDPEPGGSVAAPSNVRISLDAIPGGSSLAVISWNASTDEPMSDFKGYRVSTFTANENGSADSLISVMETGRSTRTANISSVRRGTRYISYVSALLNNGTKSDSVATMVYAGIYYNNNGSIDEYQVAGPAQSGYGWDISTGSGTQYSYTSENAANIDIHMRENNEGKLAFYSPHLNQPGQKITLYGLIGTGDDAFSQTNLQEPALTQIPVNDEEVYLVRTADGNYVKIWVREITESGNPAFSNVQFEYKVQPITGLRVLKR